jgi:hypothetical protein
MVIPIRHARFASLPERIRLTCVETVSENTMDEKRIARLFGLTDRCGVHYVEPIEGPR